MSPGFQGAEGPTKGARREPEGRASANQFTGIKAAILAGGKGTRLASVLNGGQKVIADVGGRPFLAKLVEQAGAAGITEAVLLTGHRSEDVERALGREHADVRLSYSPETEPLGTAGALRNALPLLADCESVLVMNGDSWCGVDLEWMRRSYAERACDASVAIVKVPDVSRFGAVECHPGGTVKTFSEKGATGEGYINAGVYLMARRVIEGIAPGQNVSLEREILPLLAQRGSLLAYVAKGPFLDIGTPESYSRAEAFFAGTASPTGSPR